MRKFLIAFSLMFSLCMQAQYYYIIDFTEEDLLGSWEVTEVSGDFSSIGYTGDSNNFRSFEFKDATYSGIMYYNVEYGWESFFSYISFFVTNKQMLHFVSRTQYNSQYTGISMYKLKILHFDGQILKLRTLTNNGYVTLKKRNSSSGIRSQAIGEEGKTVTYNLNGEVKNEISHGINIIKEANGNTKKVLIK